MICRQRACIKKAIAPLAIWALLFCAICALWSTPLSKGTLTDPDDYMRMVRVFDILDGRDVPSYAAPRLGINGDAEIGWSRLVDWPIAAVQGAFEIFMDRIPAAMVTGTLVPTFGLLLLVLAALWYVRPVLPGRNAVFIFFALLLSWGLMRQLMPGRVDHHFWQILLGVTAFGALVRAYYFPDRLFYPALAGLALATGLAIGADVLPWITFATAMLGMFWLLQGRVWEKPSLVYGAALAGTVPIWHLLLHDAGRLLMPVCDSLSVAWIGLAVIVGLFWAGVYVLPQSCKAAWPKRLALGAILALPLLAGLYMLFPACFHDPYQIENPLVREIWLAEVKEARSLFRVMREDKGVAVLFALPLVFGTLGVLWALWREKKDRVLWAGLSFAMLCGFALTAYQIRTLDFAQGVALAPAAWFFAAGFDKVRAMLERVRMTPRQRRLAAAGFFIACLAFFVFAAVKREDKQETTKAEDKEECVIKDAAAVLNTLPVPQTIAAFIDDGSEILFRTSHNVLAAPYHRNEDGIVAAYYIITARDADSAKAAMETYGATILMLCPDPGNIWTGENNKKGAPFAAQLFMDKLPGWLATVGSPEENGGYYIFKKVE